MDKEILDEEILCKAMVDAKEAFDESINKQGYDPAYYALYLTGYTLTTNFKKLEEISMNLNRTGFEEFKYPDRVDNNTDE